MTIASLVIIAMFFEYHVGRIRIKEQVKKAAYMKHFDMKQESLDTRLTIYENGFCDGMTYIVEEVTHEHVTYWRG